MDIRNFFGKKGSGDSDKKKGKAAPAPAPVPTKKKTKVVIHDDSDATTDDEGGLASKPAHKEVRPKKEERVDVDATAYFAKSAKTTGQTKRKDPPKISIRKHPSPKKKQPVVVDLDEDSDPSPPKKAKKVPVDLDDDSSAEFDVPKKTTKTKRKIESEDDDDEVEFDFKNLQERKTATPSPAKKTKKTSAPKKARASSPKKKATPKKEKEPLIEPTLELDSFDTENASPECLQGLTFVFSGILPGLSRDESFDYVKVLGGRVTGSISGKTSYLVVGEMLEDGRPYIEGSKFIKATEAGTIIVKGEKALYGLCKQYSDRLKKESDDSCSGKSMENQNTHIPAAVTSNDSEARPSKLVVEATPPITMSSSKPVVANPYDNAASKPTNPYAKKPPSNPYAKKTSANPYAGSHPATQEPSAVSSGDRNALWADKYAPSSTRDILGNQDSVKKLTAWLNKWEQTFNNDKAYGKTFSAPGGPWKAAMLSGPPGIGKTTTATLVALECGRDLLELNASDTRSKKSLESDLGDVTGSQVLNFGGSTTTGKNKKRAATKRRCIIMDEVDGMGAGDRSGMSELIKLIKNSKVPIICICNDRQSTKIKSLLSYCMDLRFKRPVKTVIARRAIRIGEQEGMKIEQNAAEAIAESCGNDIRQVLNSLQMWSSSRGAGKNITYKGLKERHSAINKDEILRVSMFDATKSIIEGRRGLAMADAQAQKDSLYKRSEAYFVDYSLMGLNVHQNYMKVMIGGYQEAARTKDDAKIDAFVNRMHDATLAMSDFAIGDEAVRGGDMNWGLLPFVSMMAVKTGFHAGGPNGGSLGGFPEFAGWLGKNSSRGKKSRLLSELGYHMNYKVSTDKADLRLHYIPMLRERFAELLADGDKGKIEEAIELMDEYGLDRDDVFENLDEFKVDPKAKGFGDLDSKQKTAFTKAYNQGVHKSQALVHEQGAGKIAKKAKGPKEKDPADLDAVDEDPVDESDDDEEEISEEMLKKLFGKKGRKSSAEGSKATKKAAKKKK